MTSSLAKIGILSIGDMGMGIAKLLTAQGFSVATSGKGRSNDTIERAKSANVDVLKSDVELTDACSVILSVVPPRDATATAERIIDALVGTTSRDQPLYFADLNAVAPSTCRTIAALIEKSRAPVRFVDGAIIGGPPSLKESSEDGNSDAQWNRPSIPTSGPHKLSDIPDFGEKLFSTLNMRHISPDIGAASGLKMCFASTTKGFTSIMIQSFTTAQRLGVLDELRQELQTMSPASWKTAEKGVIGMAPKAYRWVREMEEIALTFEEDGGFSQDSFRGAAKVYKAVAEDSELGQEKIGKRKRGTTVEDMAAAMAEGLDKRKKKNV
ncbi:putative 6-phosphogluconate dehydrogenase [Seiridium unicorne]|uniref:6-phosphogluconate dehydrogenase n=1 Tax=Seiridium unicorne TaxID=138068 RepID=A0ABR2UW20_9PEZI